MVAGARRTTHWPPRPQRTRRSLRDRLQRPSWLDRLGLDWTAVIVFGPLFCTTILAKWAAPAGRRDLAMSWPIIYALFALGLMIGRLKFEQQRLILFAGAIGSLALLQVVNGEEFSPASLLFMAAIYLMYTVSTADARFDGQRAMRYFSSLATFIALCGIVQFAAQFVLELRYVFPIENLLPDQLVIEGYNYQAPLTYGSKIYRSNGIFLLEPSFLSQLLGIAILVELVDRSRLTRLALYATALFLSYSGTGLVILAICLPILVVTRRRWEFVVLAAVGVVVMGLFSDALNLDVFLERAGEIDNPKSSGFERFVGGFYLFDQFLWHDPWRTFLGAGAGNFASYMRAAAMPASEMTHQKIIFEFGILGALIHLGFLLFCVLRSGAPGIIRLAVVIAFFMAGLYTAASHGMALTLLMWPAAARQAAAVAKSRRAKDAPAPGGAEARPRAEASVEPQADVFRDIQSIRSQT